MKPIVKARGLSPVLYSFVDFQGYGLPHTDDGGIDLQGFFRAQGFAARVIIAGPLEITLLLFQRRLSSRRHHRTRGTAALRFIGTPERILPAIAPPTRAKRGAKAMT